MLFLMLNVLLFYYYYYYVIINIRSSAALQVPRQSPSAPAVTQDKYWEVKKEA